MEMLKTNETKSILSKVPEVTMYFWIIKVLCTTVGETASDFLNVTIGFGLTGTSIVMGALLLVVLIFQFKSKKYIPSLYWLTVVLISIFGTLVTDNLTDNMGISLEVSTTVFSVALMLTFALWFAKEKTLSIHSIFTMRRESFYWLAILFTFALGTATGDLMAESLGLGYLVTGVIVCGVIVTVTTAWKFGLDPVLAFWIAYIMTRPLGASVGDYLSQTQTNGGLGLGATVTSAIFISAILMTVIYLSVTKRDLRAGTITKVETGEKPYAALWQVAAVVGVLMLASGIGYSWRHAKLQEEANAVSQQRDASGAISTILPLGDLSNFQKIVEDTLGLVRAGNLSAAKTRIADLEYAWDNAEARLKPMNLEKWTEVDDSVNSVLGQLRASNQSAKACQDSLESLLALLKPKVLNSPESKTSVSPESKALVSPVLSSQDKAKTSSLGDLSSFRKIEEDTLSLVKAGNLSAAKTRVDDLESAWDNAQARLRPMNPAKWNGVDKTIDNVLRKLRAAHQDTEECKASLEASLAVLN